MQIRKLAYPVAPAAKRLLIEAGRQERRREEEYTGGSWWRVSSQSVLAAVVGNKCQRTADAVGKAEDLSLQPKATFTTPCVETCPL